MQQKEENGFIKAFSIWFGLNAFMFGALRGTNTTSGVYTSAYIIILGGGWALMWLLTFSATTFSFCGAGLNFVRVYKTANYNVYYPALYDLHKPNTNLILRGVVTIFFNLYIMVMGLVTVVAIVVLFFELIDILFGVPSVIASIFGVLLLVVLSIYGAVSLRRFSTLVTVSLVMLLVSILVTAISIRGSVLTGYIGNFDTGIDWTSTTVTAHFSMFLSYCMICSSQGSTLGNYSDQIQGKKDAIGSGITIDLLTILPSAMTGIIAPPFIPKIISGTFILLICRQYLPTVLTAIYWVVAVLTMVSTVLSFTYNLFNRWATVWKTKRFNHRAKSFISSMGSLLTCRLISSMGLAVIVQKGYTTFGNVALSAMVIPLLISTHRVWKRDRVYEEDGLNS